MFGFFIDKRKKQRRSITEPRRAEFRWEPEKTDRRKNADRRKGNNTWDGPNSK